MLQPRTALGLALLLELCLYFAAQGDFAASDPLAYAVIAYDFATDPAKSFAAITTHPFDMRVGLTLPLSLLYRVFGVSTPVTNLPCLVAWLLIVVVVYAAAPTPRAKLLGLFFVITSRALVQHSTLLNPDLLCGALMACSVLCLSRRDRPRGPWWLVAAAALLVAAFLVKETALWLGPAWIYALAVDLRADGGRSTLRRFAPGLATGVVLGLAYLGLCAWLWGDPLARFRGVERLAHEHTWALTSASADAWRARLLWEPPLLIFKMTWLALVPALLAPWLVRGPAARLWVVYAFSLVLLFWFGSSSLSAYSPLPMVPRMTLPLLPGLFVLAALATDRLLEKLDVRFPDAARGRGRTPARAVALAVVLAAYAFAPTRSIAARLQRPHPERDFYAALRADVADPDRPALILAGDPNRNALTRYYFELAPPAHVTPMFAGAYPRYDAHPPSRVLVLLDLAPGSRRSTDPARDLTAQLERMKLPLLRRRGSLRLYDGGDGEALRAALRDALAAPPP